MSGSGGILLPAGCQRSPVAHKNVAMSVFSVERSLNFVDSVFRQGRTCSALTCGSRNAKGCMGIKGGKKQNKFWLSFLRGEKNPSSRRLGEFRRGAANDSVGSGGVFPSCPVQPWHIQLVIIVMIIILYLQCGFNALSLHLVDTVDWSLFSGFQGFFFVFFS